MPLTIKGANLSDVTGFRARVAEAGRYPRSVGLVLLVVSAFSGCGDGSQPDPPDMPNGGSSGRDCPSDLPSRDTCSSDMPSYELDAAPIFAERCNGCHFPGNTQSEDVFTEYEDIFDQRQTVLTRIYSCAMPPPGAAPLGTSERQTLLRWFVCGAPAN